MTVVRELLLFAAFCLSIQGASWLHLLRQKSVGWIPCYAALALLALAGIARLFTPYIERLRAAEDNWPASRSGSPEQTHSPILQAQIMTLAAAASTTSSPRPDQVILSDIDPCSSPH